MNNVTHKYFRLLLVVLLVAAAPAAHASQDFDRYDENAYDDDPLEPMNRGFYQFNYAFDTVLLRPVTVAYRGVTPSVGQDMVHNAVTNLYMPVVFANSVFQADPHNSFASLWTFLINSTVGIAGVFDVASTAGLGYRSTDFGQTLGIYGAEPGPYLVIPVIGPSNGRDAVGRVADAFINPFNYISWGFSAAYWGTTAVDSRSRNMQLIDDIYATSLDPYSTFKSGYTQHRANDIRRAKIERSKSRHSAGLE